MINKKKIKNVVVGGLIGCITLQAMLPSNVFAKPRREVPVTSLISVENDEQIAMKGNDLTLSKAKKKKQQWRIEPVDKVFCTIKSEHNNKLMQIEQDADGDWTVFLERKETLEDEQLWYVEICEEDTYRIKSKANDMCLEIEKEEDGKYSFTLGEEAEEETQLWEINEKSYDYANQYFTYLEEQNPELVSMKEQIEIEKLQEEKIELCKEFEENQEMIQELDKELENLGAIEMTEQEVIQKVNGETAQKARIAVYPNSNGVVWSSSRFCVVYNGKVIELQTLIANPTSSDSSALKSTTQFSTKAGGFKAGVKNVIGSISVTALGAAGDVGGDLANAISVYDWAKAFVSGMSKDTDVIDVTASYLVTQKGQTKMVFAKYQGTSDSTQILAYKGNKSQITITASTSNFKTATGRPQNITKNYEAYVYSNMYNSAYKSYAAKLYYNYKNKISNMNECFTVSKFSFKLLDGRSKTIGVVMYY